VPPAWSISHVSHCFVLLGESVKLVPETSGKKKRRGACFFTRLMLALRPLYCTKDKKKGGGLSSLRFLD
jgi:hypothetical protein